MPLVQIHTLEGSSPQQISTLIAEVTLAVARALDKPADPTGSAY
jgi:phenylpyruvate tautomerase PptA (4-oxalocrotonate tautomerase family)